MSIAVSPLEVFRAKGVPHRRMEDWKYSDLRSAIDAKSVEHISGARMRTEAPAPIESLSAVDIMPEWLANRIESLGRVGSMEAAARAFAGGVLALRVPAGEQVDLPLHIDYMSAGHSHIVLSVEARASLTLLETYRARGGGLQNTSLSIFLEEGARLTHIRQASFASELIAVETVSVVQAKDSRYRVHLMEGGAKLSRVEFNIALKGEGGEADLSGISVLGDHAHADITTHIDHAVPNTISRQLFKKVAGGYSRAIYQGKITVREGAVGSDSRQTAKALLLSARAEADLKPELEILADDVKCAHGAAIGDLDADSLFYLRSRGIADDEAHTLLINAFLQEVVDHIEDDAVRSSAVEFVEAGLARAMIVAP